MSVLTFFGVGVVDAEIKIDTFSHLVLQDDFSFEVPDADARSIEGDPGGLLLGLELVVY